MQPVSIVSLGPLKSFKHEILMKHLIIAAFCFFFLFHSELNLGLSVILPT